MHSCRFLSLALGALIPPLGVNSMKGRKKRDEDEETRTLNRVCDSWSEDWEGDGDGDDDDWNDIFRDPEKGIKTVEREVSDKGSLIDTTSINEASSSSRVGDSNETGSSNSEGQEDDGEVKVRNFANVVGLDSKRSVGRKILAKVWNIKGSKRGGAVLRRGWIRKRIER